MRENTALKSYVRYLFLLAFAASLVTGCSSYQPTKNVWKSTKSLWNTYVSPPATVDFEEKGNLSPRPRFHVYFAIDPITDAEQYSALKDKVCAYFPQFDTNAKDAARFFFGTASPEVEFYESEDGQ